MDSLFQGNDTTLCHAERSEESPLGDRKSMGMKREDTEMTEEDTKECLTVLFFCYF
jgi:hypothetical protein